MPPVAPPGTIVGAPRIALPFGLFSTFSLRPGGDRWEAGVQWETGTCDPVDGLGSPECDPEPTIGMPKQLDTNTGDVGLATPFTVYGHFSCTPLGYSPAAMQDLATAHLMDREEARVEQALWSGDLGNTPNFEADAVEVAPGAVPSRAVGLGWLEQFIADNYGSLGVIHVPRLAGPALSDFLVVQGGRLFTKVGMTPVALGAGYPNTGPDGNQPVDASQAWMYATPAVFGYRSDPFPSSAIPGDLMDRGQNTLTAVAERTYLLGYDPCGVGAVQIDLDV